MFSCYHNIDISHNLTFSPSSPPSSCFIFLVVFLLFSLFSTQLSPPPNSVSLYDKTTTITSFSHSLTDSLQCNCADCLLKHNMHAHTHAQQGNLFILSLVVTVLSRLLFSHFFALKKVEKN